MSELTQIGRYRIETRLGSGSHAIVYRAMDTMLNRQVALKVLKPNLAVEGEMISRFMREARAAANLIHQHIAWVLDLGEQNGVYFLAMRYVDGVPLDKLIAERGALPWDDAVRVLEQVGEALDFAHQKGMIHRDVKPQNILLSEQEGAVLTDFGLVKALHESGLHTRTDAIIGTPQYIPPEVWNGLVAGAPADQYALVCVFVEMLRGEPLFNGPGLQAIIRQHLHPGPLWNTWPTGVPNEAGVEEILRRGLAADPGARYPRIASLVADLQTAEKRQAEIDQRRLEAHRPPKIDEPRTPPYGREAISPVTPPPPARPETPPTAPGAQPAWRQRISNLLGGGKTQTFMLVMHKGPEAGREYLLDRERLVIGRDAKCDLVINDLEVSRRHAMLVSSGRGYTLQDLHSTNGTFVNQRRVTGQKPLAPGDEIALGKTIIFVYDKTE
jgi:serine/threonine-protein kinase